VCHINSLAVEGAKRGVIRVEVSTLARPVRAHSSINTDIRNQQRYTQVALIAEEGKMLLDRGFAKK
jgi:hypothetical protein